MYFAMLSKEKRYDLKIGVVDSDRFGIIREIGGTLEAVS